MPAPNMSGTVAATVTLPRQRPVAVSAMADITMETGEPTLTNVRAFLGERAVALEGREVALCLAMLRVELANRLFANVWGYALDLSARVLNQDSYASIPTTRERSLARRKDGDELARTMRFLQAGFQSRSIRIPAGIVDGHYESTQPQAEALMVDAFHMIRRLSGSMHGLRGSFFESLKGEADALVADAFPNGMPEEERRRSSVGYTRQHRGNTRDDDE